MKEPKITWYAKLKKEEEYIQTDNIYAGSYAQDIKYLSVLMQIWNNRWGTENIQTLSNFNINIYFENEEDYSLLKYCTVILNDSDILTINKTDKIGILSLPDNIELSGQYNDGKQENNPNNYINLEFRFSAPKNTKLKENDLKSLYFEIMPL